MMDRASISSISVKANMSKQKLAFEVFLAYPPSLNRVREEQDMPGVLRICSWDGEVKRHGCC